MAVSKTDERGVVEVFDARRYIARHPDADLATCGGCGRTWDDAVVTSWTPAPSARCPYEYDHKDEEAPESVQQLVAEWTAMARDLGRQHASGHGTDDNPTDAIDLNALEALTGEGTSMGELAEIQAVLEEAYEAGRAEVPA